MQSESDGSRHTEQNIPDDDNEYGTLDWMDIETEIELVDSVIFTVLEEVQAKLGIEDGSL